MRVLWFTSIPMPAMLGARPAEHAGTGGWMISLLEALRVQKHISLAVACMYPGLRSGRFAQDGVTYFPIYQGPRRRLTYFRMPDLKEQFLRKCKEVIELWEPDIIHVHGTERPYGLLAERRDVRIPIVISLQGILSQCSKWINVFGSLRPVDIIKMHSLFGLLRGIGPYFDYVHLKRRAQFERRILRAVSFVFGRTELDKAWTLSINPNARYYHIDELLRPEFAGESWDIRKIRRHSILFTNARGARSNVHTLFEAVALLKREFPTVRLLLAGQETNTGYGRFLQQVAVRLNIEIKFLGFLPAKELAACLSRTHVFVIPSLIENSPNSLCEAQLVGVPCIASYTGGIPSLIADSKTGLFFPPHDSALLAHKIRQIFKSDELAIRLGGQAKKVARRRHDPRRIIDDLLRAYEDIIREYKNGQSA